MLTLRNVSKRYGATQALAPTDLEVAPHTRTVLLGPSGSGKSTLLRLINGLIDSDGGQVHVDGTRLTRASVRDLRRRMGYVIQDGGLFPHMTARRNITLMADELKWPAERRDARVAELAALTKFPRDALDRFPADLSGGQCQRVSLMRALMLDPDLLLLDEPLGALDPITRSEIQTDLREIFRTLRKTVVMVTHDLAEAHWFADRIVLLHEGRIVQSGTFADLVERPADPFVSAFVRAQRTIAGAYEEGLAE